MVMKETAPKDIVVANKAAITTISNFDLIDFKTIPS
jgi:hypothetical protein